MINLDMAIGATHAQPLEILVHYYSYRSNISGHIHNSHDSYDEYYFFTHESLYIEGYR
jgi:hypothetical protein